MCLVFTFSAYAADNPTGLDDDVGTEIVKADSQEVSVLVATAPVQLTKVLKTGVGYKGLFKKPMFLAEQKATLFNQKGKHRYKPKIKQLRALKTYTNGSSGGMPFRTN